MSDLPSRLTAALADRYRVERELGEGGMATVYLAEDSRHHRPVAIKVLRQDLAATLGPERFGREIEIAARLQHPHIMPMHDSGEAGGFLFYVMPYVEGESLRERLTKHGELPIHEAVRLLIEVADALAYAHAHGVVHRDIKPENIMVSGRHALVMDFGVAKALSEVADRDRLTTAGMALGTPAYMAPEQAGADPNLDQRVDIYALGVLGYELLSGSPPFTGRTPQQILAAQVTKTPEPLTERRPTVSAALESVIMRALEKRPADRWQTADEMLAQLEPLATESGGTTVARTPVIGRGPRRRWRHPVLVAAGTLAVLAAAAVGIVLVPRWLHRMAVDRARLLLPQIERLADDGRYPQAYRMARQAEPTLEGDTTLARLWSVISDRLTLTTTPPGARVYERPLPTDSPTALARSDGSATVGVGDSTGFEPLGTTPIDTLRLPRTPHLLRIDKPGYAPVQRLASGELERAHARLFGGGGVPPGITLHVSLVPADSEPKDAVFVPGGDYHTVTPDLPAGLEAHLDGYFFDRYEVDNAEYREFVTSGGYRDRSLWPSPIVDGGDTLTFGQAVKRLVDRTGLPGPRGWTSQQFPPGRGDYPVTGVSWYEAAAYCAYRGEALPSVFQWEKAARDGRTALTGVVMPWGFAGPEHDYHDQGNFSSAGTVPVDAHPFGISPFGAYAMGGNVREWTANPIGDGRTVMGGSWEDPMYTFSDVGAFDPFYASNDLGFRCARVRARDARAHRDQGTFAIDIADRTPTYKPVDKKTFRRLLSYYRYDRHPLKAAVLDSVQTPDWLRLHVSYAGAGNERVLAYLWLPKSSAPPYQTLVYVPGVDVFYGESVFQDAETIVGPLIRSGRAVFSIVMKGMTGRPWGPGYKPPDASSVRFRDEVVLQARELRLGLDYLQSRSDIDMERLGYAGLSWGASNRLLFAAVDPRFKAAVLIGGGIDKAFTLELPAVNDVNFAPYISEPKLLLNGRHDEEEPWLTHGLPLWNLLRPPRKLVLVKDGGHLPPADERVPAIDHFLDRVFGPVGSRGSGS